MASADSALLVISRALFDPKPTTDDKSERYLAMALGYPSSWHVVRTIEEEIVPKQQQQEESSDEKKRRLMIVDRIYAGNPADGVDMWFNHRAAQVSNRIKRVDSFVF